MSMTVAAAAHAAGVSSKAVRLWEAKGLLPPAPRTAAGYRVFTDNDVDVLRCIRQAKTLDLSLAEIHDLLKLRSHAAPSCSQLTELLDKRIAEVDRSIVELQGLRRRLADALNAARRCHTDDVGVCDIIESATRTPNS